MAIALIQSVRKAVNGVNNTTLAFPSVLTDGSLLVATQVHRANVATNVTTPVDTRGHTYLPSVNQQVGTSTLRVTRTFHVTDATAGADTVTFDVSGTSITSVEIVGILSEWSGVVSSSPVTGTPSLQPDTDTATPTTGNTTPGVNGSLLYAALLAQASSGNTIAEEAGWTRLQQEAGTTRIQASVAYKLQTTAAADGHTWTMADSLDTMCHVVAFAPAAITGAAAITETTAAITAAGTVATAAASAIQESAGILTASATVAVAAAAAIQEAADSMAAAGIGAGLAGVGEIEEAGDALAAAGAAAISGAAAIQEAVEAVSGLGTLDGAGVMAVTEAADSLAAAGQTAIAGAAAIQEAVEAVSATGVVGGGAEGITGEAAIQEAVSLLSSVGAATIVAQSGITEVSDILTATLALLTRGAGAIVEAPDALGAQAAEAPDTAAGAGGVVVTGVGPVTEAPDTVTGIGSLESGGGVIVEAPDVVSGTGRVAVVGAGAIEEVSDDVLGVGLGIPKVSAARFTFTLNTVTGTQVVSHPTDQNAQVFRGKFFLFTSVSGSGNSAGISESFGCATPDAQWVTYSAVLDGATVTDAGDGGDDTNCIEFITAGGVTTEAAAFVSAGDGLLTINVTTAGAAKAIECLVLGGTDIEAQVGHYPNSPAGDRVISGDDFERKALLLAGGTNEEGTGRLTHFIGHRSIGAARSPNEQWAIGTRSRGDLTAGSETASFNSSDRCFGTVKVADLDLRTSQTLISLGPDSFTVRPALAGQVGETYFAVLGGPASFAVKSFTQPTTPQSQSITGMGFSPIASLFAGGGKVNTSAPSTNWRHSLGLAISNANQIVIATTDTHAANPSEAASARVTGRCMTVRSGGIPTSIADASFTSNDVDGITVNWLQTDTIARMWGVLSVGLTPQVAVEQPNSLMLLGCGV